MDDDQKMIHSKKNNNLKALNNTIQSDATNFNTDMKKYSTQKCIEVNISNVNITLNTTHYRKKSACETFLKWYDCLTIMGKNLINKNTMKLVFCLLSKYCIVNDFNGIEIDIDLYNPLTNTFANFAIIDYNKTEIKLKPFTVCDMMIIIDCRNMSRYRVYELFNIQELKKHYGGKIDFDKLTDELHLLPYLICNIRDLALDFKTNKTRHLINLCEMVKYHIYMDKIYVKEFLESVGYKKSIKKRKSKK